MTPRDACGGRYPQGGRTAPSGTPYPVPVAPDRGAGRTLAVFLAGPVIWFAHFMFVYLVAEAGCTGGGHGLRAFDPPVPSIVTLAATAVAGVASLAAAGWGYRRWRGRTEEPGRDEGGDPSGPEKADRTLAFGGFLLSLLSFVTILGVGLIAAFVRGC